MKFDRSACALIEIQHTPSVLRVYRYRLYPSAAQVAAIESTLERLRVLYNAALEERREAWRKQSVNVKRSEQEKSLVHVKRDCSEYTPIHTHLLQDVTTRLDRAYEGFFRRCKAGEKPGFPRFKGRGRYRTFSFKDAANGNGAKLVAGGKRLQLSGIGKVKIKLHRPYEGRLKTVGVTLSGDGHFYAILTCDDVLARVIEKTGRSGGVDVGLSSFATMDNGEMIANPRVLETAQREVARAQRKVSRRKRCSKRRRKAVALLAKKHAKVQRARKDFHHKAALSLVRKYDLIAVEKLNVKELVRGMLSRAVSDAAWGAFLTVLTAKAESAGRQVIAVDPRGTSQQCSACNEVVLKDLGVREHRCTHCGLVLDRDVNAARNILACALLPSSTADESRAGARPSGRSRASAGAKKRTPASSPVDPRSPYLAP